MRKKKHDKVWHLVVSKYINTLFSDKIWQTHIWHHLGDDNRTGLFGQSKRFRHSSFFVLLQTLTEKTHLIRRKGTNTLKLWRVIHKWEMCSRLSILRLYQSHSIHVWYIYANIWGIFMGSMLPYIPAPWILWVHEANFILQGREKHGNGKPWAPRSAPRWGRLKAFGKAKAAAAAEDRLQALGDAKIWSWEVQLWPFTSYNWL